MRADMAKVIVERPRWGGGVKYPRAQTRSTSRIPIEESRRREGAKRPWFHARGIKCLNENLAPLRRFLRSRVGRPWDKVYSEICERINRDSAVQLHIWQHLVQYVCTDPHVVAGDVRVHRFGFRRPGFYVDPKCGLLREAKPPPRPMSIGPAYARKTEVGWTEVDGEHCVAEIDGLWFELSVKPFPAGVDRVYDHLLRRDAHAGSSDAWRYRGQRVYVSAKRQLNKREIRRLQLATA